jgi:uncharacterized protein YhbP (UPF0306 family)
MWNEAAARGMFIGLASRQGARAAMNTDLAQRIGSFFAAHHVLSLATTSVSSPHAVSLFYACDGLALVWLSDRDSRHSRDIEANNNVAATVAPDYSDFAVIRGVQIAGTARRIVKEHQRTRHLALLEARYPFLKQLPTAPIELRQAYAQTAVYRLEPLRIVLIDNTKGFGHKETLEISTWSQID